MRQQNHPNTGSDRFGSIQKRQLTRIQKIIASTLARNWASIPHVTHNDEADVSEFEAARRTLQQSSGIKATPLAFVVKAVVSALKQLPQFNASLAEDGTTLVLKQYYNIGVAVDTPNGLLVPVIAAADRKSVAEIAAEISEVSTLARSRGLPLHRMEGGTFSISSLGAIGGTGFTPIINAPEVAILGVTRVVERPVRTADGGLAWRQMLPLSLSYDHRVLNGADAARFCVALGQLLARPLNLLEATDAAQSSPGESST